MNSVEMFGTAKWLGTEECAAPYIRGFFEIEQIEKAVLTICGLGFFECYCNGHRVSGDLFLPLYTDFCPRDLYVKNQPFGEETAHRIYCPQYDITPYLQNGKNLLCVMLAPGWYGTSIFDGQCHQAPYGKVTLCWRLEVTHPDGTISQVLSDENMKWAQGLITKYDLFLGEEQDYQYARDGWLEPEYDDSSWRPVEIVPGPESQFYYQDCPADRVVRQVRPSLVKRFEKTSIYDMGENHTGYPVLFCDSSSPETVTVAFSEELNSEGRLEEERCHGQKSVFHLDGKPRSFHTRFTWNGFRYFEVTNNAQPLECAIVHMDLPVTSSFQCDHPTLNWLYETYLRTQLSNLHSGIPSDCPHIERRGYTGDGQLTCEAVMTMLDAERFYRKWIGDISDCQDRITGHVQYTAPYTTCGGGPGGWGCAIVVVPYTFYRQYGDPKPMTELYPQMLRYFDYLEAHSQEGLIVSDKPGEWCLGDWASSDEMRIPEPYVNNYFYVKSMEIVKKIGDILGIHDQDALLSQRIQERKQAIISHYYNADTGDFAENVQGANAFAADIGLGDSRTFRNLVQRYQKLGNYDTGIFGTDLITKLFFQRGQGALAYRLLTSEQPNSYYDMKRQGATTLWEYFTGLRSHNHPMFGSVTRFLFQYILGIRQQEDSAGYEKVVIAPCDLPDLRYAKGHVTTKKGRVYVEFCRMDGQICFRFHLDSSVQAVFSFAGVKKHLPAGDSEITCRI